MQKPNKNANALLSRMKMQKAKEESRNKQTTTKMNTNLCTVCTDLKLKSSKSVRGKKHMTFGI